MFTAKDVMALREMSGAGMMDCKKALTACSSSLSVFPMASTPSLQIVASPRVV